MQVLLEEKTSTKKQSGPKNQTPLCIGVCKGYIPVIELLHKNGADLNQPSGEQGLSPLSTAINSNKLDLARFFLLSSAMNGLVKQSVPNGPVRHRGNGILSLLKGLLCYAS